jgi:hypothetical protein
MTECSRRFGADLPAIRKWSLTVLVFPECGAGAIDYAHVGERDHGSFRGEERFDAGLEAALRKGCERKDDPQGQLHWWASAVAADFGGAAFCSAGGAAGAGRSLLA